MKGSGMGSGVVEERGNERLILPHLRTYVTCCPLLPLVPLRLFDPLYPSPLHLLPDGRGTIPGVRGGAERGTDKML